MTHIFKNPIRAGKNTRFLKDPATLSEIMRWAEELGETSSEKVVLIRNEYVLEMFYSELLRRGFTAPKIVQFDIYRGERGNENFIS